MLKAHKNNTQSITPIQSYWMTLNISKVPLLCSNLPGDDDSDGSGGLSDVTIIADDGSYGSEVMSDVNIIADDGSYGSEVISDVTIIADDGSYGSEVVSDVTVSGGSNVEFDVNRSYAWSRPIIKLVLVVCMWQTEQC